MTVFFRRTAFPSLAEIPVRLKELGCLASLNVAGHHDYAYIPLHTDTTMFLSYREAMV